ncbi:restriction endonuclease [bacterium]|nr:restriction endonuclease [bacterium]
MGFIPLGAEKGISIRPKIPMQNLFRMLEYAYDLKSFKLLEGLYECESLRDFYERIAVILAERLLLRARSGLYKSYQLEQDDLSYIRGRIDINSFIRNPVKTVTPCTFEEHTADIVDNQIVAWSIYTALRSGICGTWSTPRLHKADRLLRNTVSLQTFCGVDCIGRQYNRLNSDYEILHKLCRFLLDNNGPTQRIGDRSMVPFLVDMARLFERFVAKWLQIHLNQRFELKVQESYTIGERGALKMEMDLVIRDRETHEVLCILDTKYKGHGSVKPADYNQVVAYSDALGCRSAILIYPQPLRYPFNEKPSKIRVRSATFDIRGDIEIAGRELLTVLYRSLSFELSTPGNSH